MKPITFKDEPYAGESPQLSVEEAEHGPQPSPKAIAVMHNCMRIAKLLKAVDLSPALIRYVTTDEEWTELCAWHYGKHVDQFFVDGVAVLPPASIVVPAPHAETAPLMEQIGEYKAGAYPVCPVCDSGQG